MTVTSIDKEILAFSLELTQRADALATRIQTNHLDEANKNLQKIANTSTSDGRAELLIKAGKAIFGDAFTVIPEFALEVDHATELAKSVDDAKAQKTLAHQKLTLHEPFPVDTWLYGVARVRDRERAGRALLREVRLAAGRRSDQPAGHSGRRAAARGLAL